MAGLLLSSISQLTGFNIGTTNLPVPMPGQYIAASSVSRGDAVNELETFSIGKVYLHGFEAPGLMHASRKQVIAVHEFIGGGRSVQALGGQPGNIRWHGRLVPQGPFRNRSTGQIDVGLDPIERALELEKLCNDGGKVPFVYGSLQWDVVVESFDFDIKNKMLVEYEINLVVISTPNTPTPDKFSLSGFDIFTQLMSLTDLTNGLFETVEQVQILAILSSETIAAVRKGEAAVAGVAAILSTEAIAGSLGFGVGLINAANQLTAAAVLMKNLLQIDGVL
jgi:hypothetical protein